MERPQYYDAQGRIDYDPIKSYANALRHQAIAAFWSDLFRRATKSIARLRRHAAAQMDISSRAQPRKLRR